MPAWDRRRPLSTLDGLFSLPFGQSLGFLNSRYLLILLKIHDNVADTSFNPQGRSLEELDELFEVKPPLAAWKFTKYQTTGFGRLVREIELGHNLEVKADGAEIEDVKEGIVRIDAILPSQEVEVLAKGD